MRAFLVHYANVVNFLMEQKGPVRYLASLPFGMFMTFPLWLAMFLRREPTDAQMFVLLAVSAGWFVLSSYLVKRHIVWIINTTTNHSRSS